MNVPFVIAVLLTMSMLARVSAQCEARWLPGGIPGLNGVGHALAMWDPDGTGPEDPLVVVGGEFDVAGAANSRNIAAWNPRTGDWRAIGQGGLIAGGTFATAGGVLANRVARWDGKVWSGMGAGIPDRAVQCLAVGPDGKLYAGSGSVFRWDGSAWTRLGSGMLPVGAESIVKTIAFMPGGELTAGGWFWSAGGQPSAYFARWTGGGGPGLLVSLSRG